MKYEKMFDSGRGQFRVIQNDGHTDYWYLVFDAWYSKEEADTIIAGKEAGDRD